MSKAYSTDLRDRAVAAVKGGMSRQKAAKRFSVSAASVIRWCQLEKKTGCTKPGKLGGHRPWLLEDERKFITDRISAKPDLTLEALLVEVHARGKTVSLDTLWRFLGHCGLSFKKKVFCQANKTGLTLRVAAIGGTSICHASTPRVWFSSMKPGSRPT